MNLFDKPSAEPSSLELCRGEKSGATANPFNRLFLIPLSALIMSVVASCSSYDKIVYFQDRVINNPEAIDTHAGIVIEPKDMLSIIVSTRTAELAPMFNLPVVSYQAGSEIVSSGYQKLIGYVVDNDGFIDFPVLGKLQVAGLTRWSLASMIKDKLISDGLLNDAVVTVEFMNFKISVLGEVTAPGTYTVEGDKVTILQALSLARDLTIFGQRENVSVIREENGKRTIYEVNLCTADMFKSPAYYLKQNDIVYVEPSRIKQRQSTTDDKTMRITSIAVSSGSLLVSVATLITTVLLRKK